MAKDRKKRKIRLDKKGQVRIPPVAIAYFYDRMRKLTFVFPVPSEHPDVTIKRACKQRGIPATAGHVTVTIMYWDIVKNLPSVMMTGKGENERGEKVSIFSVESMKNLDASSDEDAENKDNTEIKNGSSISNGD